MIHSDDGGATWHIGGTIYGQVNECAAMQFSHDAVYLNMRSYNGRNRRAYAWSDDEGEHWSETRLDEALVEPVCQAGLRASRMTGSSSPILPAPAGSE